MSRPSPRNRFLLALLGLASCRSHENSSAPAGPSAPAAARGSGKPIGTGVELYVEVCALTQLPYFIDHRLGKEAAGRELGVRAEFAGPADGTAPHRVGDFRVLYDVDGQTVKIVLILSKEEAERELEDTEHARDEGR